MEKISDNSGIRCSAESLIGGRSENQDSYGIAKTAFGLLLVVCDGMGGGPGGKTASSIVTQTIIDYVVGESSDISPLSLLAGAATAANEAVLSQVERNQALRGMGTTCVCVLLQKNKAFILHVGDSRCYQLRGDRCVFRTADHSYVGELVRRGSLTEEAARVSKYSNVITKAVGAGANIEPEVEMITYKPGDRFALMTDGIWGSMPEPQLLNLLCCDSNLETLVPRIAAKVDSIGIAEGGGHDNLTLLMVDIPGKRHAYSRTLNEVLGEARGYNRKSGESFQENSAAQFSLEEATSISESADNTTRDARKKTSVIFYVAVAVLIVALAVIGWFLLASNKPVKTENKDVDNTISDTTVKHQTDHPGHTTQIGLQESDKLDISATCNSVIEILLNLKNFKPVKDKNITKKSVEQKRQTMIMAAADSLRTLAETLDSSDPSKAIKIRDIETRLRGDASKMEKVDAKFFHSRKDSNSAIDDNIAAVKALVNL